MKNSKFYSGLFVFVHLRISRSEFRCHGVNMGRRARDLHDFLNVAWQTVDVRKARKIVMKSEIVLNTTYRKRIKNVRIFDQEKNWIEKIANILSPSIFVKIRSILYRRGIVVFEQRICLS